jgi:glycosyltransferase involved in cell wall biosynthesis
VSDVFVVLSTFNGELFLAEQIESLRRQTFAEWTLLVRDDGSTDSTLAILDRFAAVDSRVRILADDGGRLGPTGGFGALLEAARERGARFVFLCDQDDVWTPDKMERQRHRLVDAERTSGSTTALLVHSDLAVVDRGLNLRHPSFLANQRLKHRTARPLETLAVQNFATGCAMAVNRALLDAALPIPPSAAMHDWWLALIAAGAGRILFDSQPLVLYRQHGGNAVGANGYWKCLWRTLTRRCSRGGWSFRTAPNEFEAVLIQAEAAADRLADFHPPAGRWLAEFAALWREPSSPARRLSSLRRLRAKRLDPLRHFLLQTRLYLADPPARR